MATCCRDLENLNLRRKVKVNFLFLIYFIHPEILVALNERKIDINISGLDVDDPLRAIPPSLLLSSRVDQMNEIAKRDGLTIPVLDQGLIDSRGDFAILGSLVQIPDHVQSWFEEGAVEIANFMP
jgi:hypothetical protein